MEKQSSFPAWITTLVIITLLFTNCNKQSSKTTQHTAHQIIGYLAGWSNISLEDVNMKKMTILNYAFANIHNNKIVFEYPYDKEKITLLRDIRDRKNPNLKILVSLGGWGWSDHFSDMALTSQSRKIFIDSAIKFITDHQLDGLDLDWEYPGQPGEGNIYRAQDKKNFTLLIKELRKAMQYLEKTKAPKTGDHYLLTIAAAANQAYLDHTQMDKVQKYLDYINIMTYDFRGFGNQTGHHANLSPSLWDENNKANIHSTIDAFIRSGVPPHKIVMGVPFYGRGWTQVEKNDRNGLHVKTHGEVFSLSYGKIQEQKNKDNGYLQFWDNQAQAPYIYSEKQMEFITYDNPKSLKYKCDYLKSKRLGGVMFWKYSDDYQEQLLDTLWEQLTH